MNPAQIAKDSESSHQQAFFAMCALHIAKYPELKWIHSIPNGAVLGNDPRTRVIRAGKLKAEGMKNGVSDISFPCKRGNYSGLFIEMKKPALKPVRESSKGGVSDEQIEFANFVIAQGFCFQVCYSWEEAWNVVQVYLNL